MAAQLIGPLWNERTASTSVNAEGVEILRVILPFLVLNKGGGALEALACPDLPQYGDRYASVGTTDDERDNGLMVVGKPSVSQHENHPRYWRVEVEFGSEPFDPVIQSRNPLLVRQDPRWGRERFREALESDLDGNALVNAAGVPYQAVELDSSFKVVELSRNLPTWEQEFMDAFEDLVNTDVFAVEAQEFAAGRCKVHEISTTGRKYNAVCGRYWPSKLVVHIKPIKSPTRFPKPWHLYLLNAGLEWYDVVTDSLIPFREAPGGRPLSTPQLLAADGSPLVGPFGGPLPPGTDPEYLDFRVHPEGSYAELMALFVT